MTKIHIRTYGCSLNQSDSEAMAGLLKKAGFGITDSIKGADVVIINTCTVKQPTENKFLNYLSKLKKIKRHIIIAGCLPQTTPEKVSGFSLVGPSNINHIVEVVEETLNNNQLVMLVKDDNPRLNLPKVRKNNLIEIIPISSGCLGSCSYCIVKRSRGDLVSYDPSAIASQAGKAIRDGVREIWLTAQDTGCYGKDIGKDLPFLLEKLLSISGNFMIRLGMMNPNYALEFFDKLMRCYSSKKLFKFIHLPVQSGNDEILKRMNRRYTVKDFEQLIRMIRKEHPDMTIATDVICGFPGEDEKQFNDTVELVKRTKPQALNISRYWERPNTPASKMERKLHPKYTKERSRLMNSAFDWIAYENNKRWIGWRGHVITDEYGKDNTTIARNFAYKQVVIPGKLKLGKVYDIKVTRITKHDLRARLS